MAGMIFSEVVGAFVRVGITNQSIKCLPGTVFAIRQSPPKTYQRDQMIAYRSRGLTPLLPDGYVVAKLIAGLPGDLVEVTPAGISINGTYWGPLNATVRSRYPKANSCCSAPCRAHTMAAIGEPSSSIRSSGRRGRFGEGVRVGQSEENGVKNSPISPPVATCPGNTIQG